MIFKTQSLDLLGTDACGSNALNWPEQNYGVNTLYRILYACCAYWINKIFQKKNNL